MNRTVAVAALVLLASTGSASAQSRKASSKNMASGQNMASGGITSVYNIAKGYLLKTAEQVPQDKYSFQPTKEVRTLGAMLGHVADANSMFCAIADGKPQPPENAGSEKLTDKAALIAALNAAFAYCDGVLAKITDSDLKKPRDLFGMKSNVAGVMTLNAAHDMEHYGNLVTYMRIIGMVPPSSQRGAM